MLRKLLLGLFILGSVIKADINDGKRNVNGYLKYQGASYVSFRSMREWKGNYIYQGVATVRGSRVVFTAIVDPRSNNILDIQMDRD